jgi:hypothetical protein
MRGGWTPKRGGARASWETRIFRDDPEGEAEAEARFWLRLSPAERVRLAWPLSQEMHALPTQKMPPLSLDFRDLLSELSAADARFLFAAGPACKCLK